MQWRWLLIFTAAVKEAAGSDACLSSIKVIDNFLTDEESRILLAGVKEKVLSSGLPRGHAVQKSVQRRLQSVMHGDRDDLKETMIPVSQKEGHVPDHQDYVNGKKEDGLVQGTAAVVYLHSAPDGQSVGRLLFKNQEGEQVKVVEATGKRFVSWDNQLCSHGFLSRDLPRTLIGPFQMARNGLMALLDTEEGVDQAPSTSSTSTTTSTDEPSTTKYRVYRRNHHRHRRWWHKNALSSLLDTEEEEGVDQAPATSSTSTTTSTDEPSTTKYRVYRRNRHRHRRWFPFWHKNADSSLLDTEGEEGVDQAPATSSTSTTTSTDEPSTTKYRVYRRNRHRHRRWFPFWHKNADSSLLETDDSVHFMQLPTDL